MLRTLILAVALLPSAASAQAHAASASSGASARTIHVNGEGQVSIRPDVAVVFAGVTATGKDLAKVTAEANAGMRRMLDAIGKGGVPAKDVQTTRHEVSVDRPWTDKGPGPVTGYTVIDEVRLTIRDLARLGPVIDRVLAAGSNTLRSLSFEKEDSSPEQARALAAAYASARAKADALARAAGVTLGDVVTMSAGGQARPYPMMRSAMVMEKSDGAPVSPGEVEVGATVDVTFAIR
jgi:uncharacterized protein YggE